MLSDSVSLRVRSWFIDGVDPHAPAPFAGGLPSTVQDFLAQLPQDTFNCWVRGHSGLVGFGRAARLRASGSGTVEGRTRFDQLSQQWRTVSERAQVEDAVRLPGSGLVGFTAIAFADDSDTDSVIDIPRFIMGRRHERVWLTSICPEDGADDDFTLESTALSPVAGASLHEGRISQEQHIRNVSDAVALMRAPGSRFKKIVLARDAVVDTPRDIDVRAVLGALNADYPATWTFNVAGMIGATPELLVGAHDGVVRSRVLAGTYQVRDDAQAELAQARQQLAGAKDSQEHIYATHSLEESLRPYSSDLHVDEQPYLLTLPNVIHLATDAHGTLDSPSGRPKDRPSIIDLAKSIHPTAAVGGVPRNETMREIARIEGADRGRYAGPVGWIDGAGNGQLGIALRCGQLESRTRIRLWAGGGIMPDSDPQSELAESWAKLGPMLQALGVSRP
ncbi:isochorismate synthase MenF [Brevibacterium sp. HMSC063G07]|uniref:isochorismate synthase n=1 Tax=Brevibacterium sp. HMSC063G07 TaxID=1739261 RepID=UPI0008A492F5|nr:chorismate-binding protein [Brevibacterium sp. HMSC063G07]OFL66421.1 isochorismate synthase [Brevibacterium sp. HMSC063G07]